LATTLYSVKPVFSKHKDQWSVRIGGKINVLQRDTLAVLYLYPEVDFRFKIIDNYLRTFLGVTGYLEHQNYEKLSLVNPYMRPGQEEFRTNHPYVFYAGLNGYLSKKASYEISLSYEAIAGMPFFVNYVDSLNYRNQFEVVTDNPDLIKLHFEFNWKPVENLEFLLRSNYYSYTMYTQVYPWHLPVVDLNLTTRYNIHEKLFAELDFIALGKRYSTTMDAFANLEPARELEPIYDLNLKLEYKYSDILSFFLNGYNLINQHYYFWNQYRSQGFNIMGGFSYKF
jgi:hypothetical protein